MRNNLVVVLDNGASSIKAGIANGPSGTSDEPRCVSRVESSQKSSMKSRIITNAVVRSKGDKKTYFGHEFEQCKDYASLHYRLPFEKVCTSTGPTYQECCSVY